MRNTESCPNHCHSRVAIGIPRAASPEEPYQRLHIEKGTERVE